MRYVLVGLAVLGALYSLHRIAVWAEGRGWIYYRTRQGSSGALGNAFLEVQANFDPSAKHVLVERMKEDPDAQETGDPPAGGSMDVRESYDAVAAAYAEHLADELAHKPLDRHLLNRFAEATRGGGLVADLGCGPGHVARYLSEQGVTIVGIDFSAKMVAVAQRRYPELEFRVEDMRSLKASDASLAGIVLFYSIVHFDVTELPHVFREARRVLVPGGLALLAFHIGEEIVHRDELFGVPVTLDFRCHTPESVVDALRAAQLAVIEHIEREPYDGAEYPSRRCYLVARAT